MMVYLSMVGMQNLGIKVSASCRVSDTAVLESLVCSKGSDAGWRLIRIGNIFHIRSVR